MQALRAKQRENRRQLAKLSVGDEAQIQTLADEQGKTTAELAALRLLGFAALGLIVVSFVFPGLQLGAWFSIAMIVLASGFILYDTSNVLHHYRIGQHVAASLALFASVALLFWYLVLLFMSRRN